MATSRLPHGYSTSVLPAAIIQSDDGDVVLGADASAGLDPVVAPWYRHEQSTLEDWASSPGSPSRSTSRSLAPSSAARISFATRAAAASRAAGCCCPVGARAQHFSSPTTSLPFVPWTLLVTHLETHTGGLYRLGVLLERTRDLEAELGDEAEAFVLTEFVDAREAAEVVVIAWRTDNLVQLLWDIQDRGTPGGVEALMDAAEHIERRTEAQRQSSGD